MNNTLFLNPPISINRPLVWKIKLNLRIFWILSLILMGTLLVFYIFQINSIVQKIYLLQSYEKKLNEVSEKNKKLEIDYARVNSLENIESLVKNLNYEKVGEIRYIQVLDGQVVSK